MTSGFRFGHLGYLLCAFVTAAVCGAFYAASRDVDESWARVESLVTLLDALSTFAQEASAAESAHRGWVLVHAASFRTDRDAALGRADAALDRMRRLASADLPIQDDVAQLDELLERRQMVMNRGEALWLYGAPAPEVAHATAAAAREAMGRLLQGRDELRRKLLAALDGARAEQRRVSRAFQGLLAAGLAMLLLVLFPAYWTFLRESRARMRAETLLRDIAENVPAAVFRLRQFADGRRRFEFASENVSAVRGVRREDLLRDADAILSNVIDEDRSRVLAAIGEAAAAGRPIDLQYRTRRSNGELRWTLMSAKPRAEPDGSVLWHGYWKDVTARRALENEIVAAKERAEQASRSKSLFLAAMSHEIRTPMTGVLGMIELLSLAELPPEQRHTVHVLHESSAALLRIIDDVLDWSRIEAGKFELRMQPAPLECIVQRVGDLFAAIAAKKGLRLGRSTDLRLHAHYRVDAVRLQQILANLVSNAVKFTERGEVAMRLTLLARGAQHDMVCFEVRDTGIGISAEEQSRLFAPFSQAGDAGSRTQGSGLGLSISRRLAELMGGSVSLESEPGRGTIARLALPLARTSGDEVKAPLPVGATPRTQPRGSTILVVDDDPVVRVVLERQLAALGYGAETTASAHEALERCHARPYSAVLVDCSMPELDGYEFTRRLRAREAATGLPRTPVIAFTARAFREDIDAARAAGMDDHLAKPADLGRLREVIQRWLRAPAEGSPHA